jgi:post-segregation antitoxin (ccd killing protein)
MRMNISVPDDLAKEVRDLDIPISRICQQALDREVRRVKMTRIPTRDLQALAERLFNAEDLANAETFQDGYDDGMEWALKYASSMEELQEIADLHDTEFRFSVNTESICDFYSAKIMETVISTDLDSSNPETYGFVAGAQAVLENVRALGGQR